MSDKPMWCDDFDMDLPKVIPAAMDVIRAVPDTVRLATHGHLWNGTLNHPSVWNTHLGMSAYFVVLPDGMDVSALTLGHVAPSSCWTNDPIVACSFVEAIRDCWCHNYAMVIDGVVVWDTNRFWPAAFEPLMYHVRGWQLRSDDEVEEYRRRVVDSLKAATARLLVLLADREVQRQADHARGRR